MEFRATLGMPVSAALRVGALEPAYTLRATLDRHPPRYDLTGYRPLCLVACAIEFDALKRY